MDRSRMQPDPAGRGGCLSNPLRTRGTAFTHDERLRLGIEGLLPPRVESLEEQAARVLANVRGKTSQLEKYRYLSALQAGNERLFYRGMLDNLGGMRPM